VGEIQIVGNIDGPTMRKILREDADPWQRQSLVSAGVPPGD
jgi:hypothetical protein